MGPGILGKEPEACGLVVKGRTGHNRTGQAVNDSKGARLTETGNAELDPDRIF